MSDYEYFAESVGILKQAAIDAWMVDVEGFTIAGSTGRVRSGRDRYVRRFADRDLVVDSNPVDDVYQNVSRPDSSGRGGGDVWFTDVRGGAADTNEIYELRSKDYPSWFDGIIETVNGIVSPWLDPVDLARIAPILGGLNRVAAELGQGNLGSGGDLLADCSDLVSTAQTSDLSGTTISSFRKAVIAKLDPKIYMGGTPLKALCSVSVVLTSHVAAEKAAWAKAREQVADIVNSAFLSFTAVAERSRGDDWAELIEVVKVAAQVVKEIVPGADKWAAVADSIELDLLVDRLVPEPAKMVKPAGTYGSILEALRTNVQRLNEEVERVETGIRDAACQNLDIIGARSNREYFVLKAEGIRWTQQDYADYNAYSHDGDPDNDVIRIVPSVVMDVKASLDTVAEDFRRIARMLETIHPEMWSALSRDARLGYGPNGPAAAIMELAELLHDLLGTFAWSVEESGEDLKLACDALTAQNEAARAALEAQYTYMAGDDRGNVQSGIDLWDYSVPSLTSDQRVPPTIESRMRGEE